MCAVSPTSYMLLLMPVALQLSGLCFFVLLDPYIRRRQARS